jgi:hypothetical protein
MDTVGRSLEGVGGDTGRVDGTGRAATAGRAAPDLTCNGMRRVVLEEMALRRRRLGELTPAQERALETLLVSVADNISALLAGAAAKA